MDWAEGKVGLLVSLRLDPGWINGAGLYKPAVTNYSVWVSLERKHVLQVRQLK